MSILSDHQNAKSNARQHLLLIYRELREVLLSDLCWNEQHHLFTKAHDRDVQPRLWLLAPDKYDPDVGGDDFLRPLQHDGNGVVMLRSYLDSLGELLNYRALRADLLSAVDDVSAVMDREHRDNRARQDALAHHGARLHKAFAEMCLRPGANLICTIGNGYAGDLNFHQAYVNALLRSSATA